MAIVDFRILIPKAGFVWVTSDECNVFDGERIHWRDVDRPVFRVRPPWNSKNAPRILLRPAHVSRAELILYGKWDNNKSRNLLRRQMLRHGVPAGRPAGWQRDCEKDHRVVFPAAEDSALFRNFARLETNTDAIAEFANRFGLLWHTVFGVPHPEWEYEINTMRFLIDMWDAVVGKQTKSLDGWFKKFPGGFRYLTRGLSYRRYGWQSGELVTLPNRGHGNLLQVARDFVVNAVNARLQVLGGHFELQSKPFATKQHPERRPDLAWQPNDLLGLLWFQFAESIGEDTQYRQCEMCPQYMEISLDANRSDRRYCSDACRNRALRRRKKLALQMRKEKKSLSEISAATGSDITTLKKWFQTTTGG